MRKLSTAVDPASEAFAANAAVNRRLAEELRARAGHLAVVHVAGSELTDLEERRAGIQQALDAVARKQFAALDMARSMLLRPTFRRLRDVGPQLLRKRAIMRSSSAELFAVGRDFALDPGRAHALRLSISRKALPLA